MFYTSWKKTVLWCQKHGVKIWNVSKRLGESWSAPFKELDSELWQAVVLGLNGLFIPKGASNLNVVLLGQSCHTVLQLSSLGFRTYVIQMLGLGFAGLNMTCQPFWMLSLKCENFIFICKRSVSRASDLNVKTLLLSCLFSKITQQINVSDPVWDGEKCQILCLCDKLSQKSFLLRKQIWKTIYTNVKRKVLPFLRLYAFTNGSQRLSACVQWNGWKDNGAFLSVLFCHLFLSSTVLTSPVITRPHGIPHHPKQYNTTVKTCLMCVLQLQAWCL